MLLRTMILAFGAIVLFFNPFLVHPSSVEQKGAPIYRLMLQGNLANDSVTLSKNNTTQGDADSSMHALVSARKEFDAVLPSALKAAEKHGGLTVAIKEYYAAQSAYLSGADPSDRRGRANVAEKESRLKLELQLAGF